MAYDYYIVKTYNFTGGGSNASIRVSPLAGQGVGTDIKVECSRGMRASYPVGTLFKIQAKITSRELGASFLYSHPNWNYEVVSSEQAEKYIKGHFK